MSGVLDMANKQATNAMHSIDNFFMLDCDATLDEGCMQVRWRGWPRGRPRHSQAHYRWALAASFIPACAQLSTPARGGLECASAERKCGPRARREDLEGLVAAGSGAVGRERVHRRPVAICLTLGGNGRRS